MKGWKFESHRHMLASKGIKTMRSDKYFSGKSMNSEWNVDQSYQPVKEIRDDEVIISSTYGKLKMTKEEYDQLTKQHENINKVPVDQIVGDLALMREEKRLVKEGNKNTVNALFARKMRQKELLIGGKGDNKPDFLFNKEQLAKGMKVESEHTKDPRIQKEIAKDHLTESKDYYKSLNKMENKLERKK
jgi:hypothetical protein